MRIAVIGAGLAGVSTAFELALNGHETTVFERRGGVAAEGSFAPACIAAPGSWVAQTLSGPATGIDPLTGGIAMWPSRFSRWRASRRSEPTRRLQLMAELSRFGQGRLRSVSDVHQLSFERHVGVLALLRTTQHAQLAQALLETHKGLALPVRWLDETQVRSVEPGLRHDPTIAGALHWPAGTTANGRQFAQSLKAVAQALGARFLFRCEVSALREDHGTDGAVELQVSPSHEFNDTMLAPQGTGSTTVPDDPCPTFDAAVICSAEAAARLIGRAGGCPSALRSHVHSVTAPLREPNDAGETYAPAGAVLDPARRITLARMGERLRVAGGATFGPRPPSASKASVAMLYDALEDTFPGAARIARGQVWTGRQTSTADGLPVVGPSGRPGVWHHWGHGANAWAWVPATSSLLAEQMGGRPPSLDTALLTPSRLL
jgi:D-amino-acid dehydrogenase